MIEYRLLAPEDRLPCLPAMLELIDGERRDADSLLYFGALPTNEPHLKQFFPPTGTTWGAFEDGRLKAFALLGLSHLVRELWLPYIAALGADRRACGVLFGTIVHRPCRGGGVGAKLHRHRAAHAREQGIRHLFTLVHPKNIPSLRLLREHGFSDIDRLDSYKQSGPRVLMHGSLHSTRKLRECQETALKSSSLQIA